MVLTLLNIFHTILLVTIYLSLLMITAININCYDKKTSMKTKNIYYHINNIKMVRNNDLKEIVIKNYTCNYFDDMININNLDDILLNEKSYNNISIYHATYKTSYDQKPFCIILYKVDGYIRKHDSTKYLALFRSDEKYERIFDRIRYLII